MADMGLGAGLSALAFWGFVSVAVIAGIWESIRKREAQHETLRRLIASGQPVDPALMDKLTSSGKNLGRDLKVGGFVVLFTGPGIALLGWFIGLQAPEWFLPLLGVGALVGCIGIGLLVASWAIKRSDRNGAGSAAN